MHGQREGQVQGKQVEESRVISNTSVAGVEWGSNYGDTRMVVNREHGYVGPLTLTLDGTGAIKVL